MGFDPANDTHENGQALPQGNSSVIVSEHGIAAATKSINIPANTLYVSVFSDVAAMFAIGKDQSATLDKTGTGNAGGVGAGGWSPSFSVKKFARDGGAPTILFEAYIGNLNHVAILCEGKDQQ